MHNMIQNRNCIIFSLEMVYNGYAEFHDHMPIKPIPIVLWGDTAILKSSVGSSGQSVYVFHIFPHNGKLPLAVILLIPCKSESSSFAIVNAYEEIAQYLNKIGFIVRYRDTDGDDSVDFIHNDFEKNN